MAFSIFGIPRIGEVKADDNQVNTYTTGLQAGASVALDADGDFVVVWQSDGSGGTDSSDDSIQGQRYDSDGFAVGVEFQVNTYTTSRQLAASVALDSDGDFVVVWTSWESGADSSSSSVQGQRYASDGSLAGSQFQVNTHTMDSQGQSSVALAPGGDFVVVWASGTATTGSIQGQRYASDGSLLGVEIQINTYTTGSQLFPSVAVAADGDFVVVWQSLGSGGTDFFDFSVQGQRYDSGGALMGGQFQVNTYTPTHQRYPAAALDSDGDFVVVWESFGSGDTDSSEHSIQGQRYASDGSPLSGEFQVNTYTTGSQYHPSVALDSDGDFVVVWESEGSGGTDLSVTSIQGQRFASDGLRVSGEFQVNTYTTGVQGLASVGLDAAGNFVVVWHSGGSGGTDGDSFSVQKADAGFVGRLVFADGFESGDTGAWN